MVIKIPEQLRNCRFIKVAEKRPIEKDWQNTKNYSYDEMSKILEATDSYGVLCGKNNLVVIDFDNAEIQKEMLNNHRFLYDTFTVKTAGKGLYHCYFFLKDTKSKQESNIAINDNDGVRIIDVQVNKKMVVGPGTILTNGRSYEIVKDKPIREISYKIIEAAVTKYGKNINATAKKTKKQFTDPDIDKMTTKINISDVLNTAGIQTNRDFVDNQNCDCPFHESENHVCFSFNNTDNLWNCWHCNENGNIIHLYQKIKKIDSYSNAKRELMKKCGFKSSEDDYFELPIREFVVHKNKNETSFEIKIDDFFISLKGSEILNPSSFRKQYFIESNRMLPLINNAVWTDILNEWSDKYRVNSNIIDKSTDEEIIANNMLKHIGNISAAVDSVTIAKEHKIFYYSNETSTYYYPIDIFYEDVLRLCKSYKKIDKTQIYLILCNKYDIEKEIKVINDRPEYLLTIPDDIINNVKKMTTENFYGVKDKSKFEEEFGEMNDQEKSV